MRYTTIDKDKKRNTSIETQFNTSEAWKLSYKYSTKLLKDIDKVNIYLLCNIVYNQYMIHLRYKKIFKKNKKYVQIWNTMLNTIKQEKNMKMSIRLLHLTSIKRHEKSMV